jgi:hypothetical protein
VSSGALLEIEEFFFVEGTAVAKQTASFPVQKFVSLLCHDRCERYKEKVARGAG